ncbi:HD domain-containing protein [Candidatus Bathyarchaeota archaeon A05DMB-4]|jgi:HD superfamily phosphodiesterase|nr:HD domain-containing protein [Candidatus Bathyarchaeota archaeon A05DMB-4]MDH7595035.1 HD domain-containing protein [Candidatus Bathyarchaeota archaeon]
MSSLDLFAKISSFVEAHLLETGNEHVVSPTGPKYVFEHSLRVAFWCWRLALEAHADVSRCVAAGLFHDVSRFEAENPEAQAKMSAQTAREYMLKAGFKKEFIAAVMDAVQNRADDFGKHKTLETKILQDANKIDELGYIRLFLFMKTSGESFSTLKENAESFLAEVTKIEKDDYGLMWTSMGKARMKTQVTTIKTFLNGLLEEIENTETTMR